MYSKKCVGVCLLCVSEKAIALGDLNWIEICFVTVFHSEKSINTNQKIASMRVQC